MPTRPTIRRIGSFRRTVVALLCMALATAALVVGGQPAAGVAAPAADAPAVALIGDSTMLAMRSYASTAGGDPRAIVGDAYTLTFDAESCRRLVNPSCGQTHQPVSTLPLMRTALQGKLGEALVIMAGYDDTSITGGIDQIMAEATSQGVSSVLWLNYPTSTAYVLPGGMPAKNLYTSHNAALTAGADRHPSLRVLDWDTYTNDFPEWFSADGIHLNRVGAFGLATYIKAALDADRSIGRCQATRAQTGSPSDATGTPLVPDGGFGFVPIEPERVLDTRDAAMGGEKGKLGGGRTVTIDVSDVVPANAAAAVLSVTAVDSCLPGYLTVFACGARPPTSNVNYEVGRVTAGLAIAPIVSGDVCVSAFNTTDLVVDVMGAFTPDGQRFHPMTPTRFVDTRPASAGSGTPLLPDVTGVKVGPVETTVQIGGVGDVPSNATAAWLNLTIADPTQPTVLGTYPGPCADTAGTSNVNSSALRSTAAAVLVGLGANGSICIRTVTGRSHIVVDVAGWFGPGPAGLRYMLQNPTRLLDTRDNSGVASDAERLVAVSGVAVLNVAAANSSALGFVSVRPCGAVAVSSLLNTVTNEVVANVTAVASGANGQVCIDPNISSHLVVDQVATFVP